MRKNLVLTPLMVALAAGAAFAQDTGTAVLTGRVTAAGDNSPLAGVRVRIESPSMLGVRTATTDAGGNFRVSLLPNGQYSITYSLDGYISRKITMRLTAGQTVNGSARLNVISAQAVSVEITAQHTQVDKTDTVVQTTFSSDYLEKITGRSLNALGALAPGVNTSNLETQDRLNIRGGTGRSTKTLLNGSNMTDITGGSLFGSFNVQDLIESVALIQSPLNTKYGGTDGGIMTIVTSKGSNTFTGTIRMTGISRSYWSVLDQGYAQRDGRLGGRPTINTTDLMGKNYEVSVKGPIWKDHITFAYGGKLSPTSYTTALVSNTNNDGAIWTTVQGNEVPFFPSSNRGRPQDRVGLFYEDPSTGIIIRKPEMWLYNTPEGAFDKTSHSVYNQFTVFGQITPNHQVEYNYSQNKGQSTGDSQAYAAAQGSWSTYETMQKAWNLVYKGIIGSNGVLDINYGATYRHWRFGDGSPNYPIRSWTMASRVPRDGNRNNHDLNNYWSNGFVWASVNTTVANSILQDSGNDPNNYNQNAGFRNQLHNGINVDTGDWGDDDNLSINYQHLLSIGNMGKHMIDVGMSHLGATWFVKISSPLRFYDVPGTIANDLTNADIYNPRGAEGINASTYAGKYIVFNVATATLNDIDPRGVARFNVPGNVRFADRVVNGQGAFPIAQGTTGWGVQSAGGNFLPQVLLRSGTDDDSTYYTYTRAYYLNDLWTINDNHSVMAGVRFDDFNLTRHGSSYYHYTQPTLRMEYKWDIHGDQSRMVNVSWGQFHSFQPTQLFRSQFNTRGSNTRRAYWVTGSSTPHLVELADLMNPTNYGLQSDWSTPISPGSTLEGIPSLGTAAAYKTDPNWKAPISTEFQLGFRRNLTLGGTWKATFVYRSFINDFDYFPGDLVTVSAELGGRTLSQRTIERVLKNTEGYERKYTGVELEWDYPIFKRVTFGGSYTYNRLMSTVPDLTDSSAAGTAPGMNLDEYWDYMVGETFGVTGKTRRDLWRPSMPMNPEHYFKWYLLFDLSSGKIEQSIAFRGDYTSGSFQNRTFQYRFGFPTDWNTDWRQLIQGTAGGDVGGTTGTGGFGSSRYIWALANSVATNDGWGVNMRYSVTVPVSKRMRLLTIVNMSSPFNHRGKTGGYSVGGGADTLIVPTRLTTGSGSPVAQYSVYGVNNDWTKNVWRPNLSNTGHNGNFAGRQGGRSMSLEAGLRF